MGYYPPNNTDMQTVAVSPGGKEKKAESGSGSGFSSSSSGSSSGAVFIRLSLFFLVFWPARYAMDEN